MRNIRGRLGRLERAARRLPGCCPDCPPIAMVTEDANGDVLAGAYPEPCSRCGGPYGGGIRVFVVKVPAGYTRAAPSPETPM